MATSDARQTTMALSFSKCFFSDKYEESLEIEKRHLSGNRDFVRFLDSDRADFVVYEKKRHY